ncbi:unnamed protein product [Auanema sp. JU1783]|nr:unnamed protein product [Auanema sp. JU1783]
MDYVAYSKIIAQYIYEANSEVKRKIAAKFKQRSIDDVAVLNTMLERCSESSNWNLKQDLEKHKIPARLQKVAQLVQCTHKHAWNGEQASRGYFSFFQCIEEENDWNSTGQKIAIAGAGVFGGIFLLGIPTIITGKIVYDISSHASEVEKQLSWLVNEIEALYDQTHSLMLANIV